MRRLAYCILREGGWPRDAIVRGVEGFPLSRASEGGLAVAFSLIPDGCTGATVPRLAAYARAIEAIHRVSTVLPLRYGCFLNGEIQLVELLRVRAREFRSALDEVDGCVEMGLRVMSRGAGEPVRGCPGGGVPCDCASSGRAYLADRQEYYARNDCEDEASARAIDRARRAFDGLFVRSNVARSCAGRLPLLSLFFLIPRENVGPFREAFSRLEKRGPDKMLLTGPWPPYSFAGGDAFPTS